jgi:DNA-binding IclR family transcriptional regulator
MKNDLAISPVGAQSVDRALKLLKLVASRSREGTRLIDLIELSGLQKPTIHRLLKQLVTSGMLMQGTDKRYHLGQFSYELGLAAAMHFRIRETCEPFLERIANLTGDTAFLVVRSGADSFCVDRKMGAYPIKVFTVEVGHRQPLGVGGAGLALLSALPDDDVEEIIQANDRLLEQFGALTGAKLRELVESSRNRGYSLISDFAVTGVTGIGKAILDRSGYPLAAISVTTVSQRMDDMHRNMVSQILKSEVTALAVALSHAGAGRTR